MSTELQSDSFLRIASISIACYDYLATIPVELHMYRSIGKLNFRWSTSIVLFILIRYVSIILLILSNVGWFYHGFSPAACSKYYLVPPVFKVIQVIISQIIIGYRTWNISRRSRDIGTFFLAFGFMVAVLESYSNLDSRTPIQKGGNCSPGNLESHVPQWVFYLLSALFDVTAIVLSSFFLINSAGTISRMTSVIKMLLYDGFGYVVVLTVVNIMNLILYRNSIERDTQASGASFGFTFVWIMSQKLLIHAHEVAEVRAQRGFIFGPNCRGITQSVRTTEVRGENGSSGLDVQVQVERAVIVDYDPKAHRKSKAFWDRKQSNVTSGDTSSADQSQWELSSVIKTVGDV